MVCTDRGTEIAQPLLRHTMIAGTLYTPANRQAEWKIGVDVPPSPKNATATSSLRCSFAANAVPTAWGICVATGDATLTKLRWRTEWCTGICRPFTGSSALPNSWHMNVRSE